MKIIYQDKDLLVIDKPAGIDVIEMMDLLVQEYPELKEAGEEPRHGLIHRLDKDTSGVVLVAKNKESLVFFQKQFSGQSESVSDKKEKRLEKKVKKRYIALVVGNIKNDSGKIETLIGRGINDRKKQKVYLPHEPNIEGKREAITDYRVIERFSAPGGPALGGKNYTLLEVSPRTGRKHQIRVHLSYLNHPIVGDKVYGFKGQSSPNGLDRQFLHAKCIKIKMLNGETKEFCSELPNDLQNIINKLAKDQL